ATPIAPCTWFWARSPQICISPERTLPFGPHGFRVRPHAGRFGSTRPWPGSTPGHDPDPIFGAIAYDQKSKGEKVHGVGAAHGPVAIVTASAFGAALLSVSLKW